MTMMTTGAERKLKSSTLGTTSGKILLQTTMNTETTTEEAVKPVKPRIGVSRVLAEVEGTKFWIQLRRDGLHIRQYHTKKDRVISFQQLTDAAIGQFRMF